MPVAQLLDNCQTTFNRLVDNFQITVGQLVDHFYDTFGQVLNVGDEVVYTYCQRFVKGKSSLNKYQHHMIRDMAYFEALYNEMLNDKKAKVETLEGYRFSNFF